MAIEYGYDGRCSCCGEWADGEDDEAHLVYHQGYPQGVDGVDPNPCEGATIIFIAGSAERGSVPIAGPLPLEAIQEYDLCNEVLGMDGDGLWFVPRKIAEELGWWTEPKLDCTPDDNGEVVIRAPVCPVCSAAILSDGRTSGPIICQDCGYIVAQHTWATWIQ